MNEHLWNMKLAMEEAEKAYHLDEVPVGALVVDRRGQPLARAHNLKEKNNNPCHHAEILAITESAKKLKQWRLSECTLYVSLEPCIMCLGAMVSARIDRLFFAAYDEKSGALSLGLSIHAHPRLNHEIRVVGGLMHYESSQLLSGFFKTKRASYQYYQKK